MPKLFAAVPGASRSLPPEPYQIRPLRTNAPWTEPQSMPPPLLGWVVDTEPVPVVGSKVLAVKVVSAVARRRTPCADRRCCHRSRRCRRRRGRTPASGACTGSCRCSRCRCRPRCRRWSRRPPRRRGHAGCGRGSRTAERRWPGRARRGRGAATAPLLRVVLPVRVVQPAVCGHRRRPRPR